MKRSVKTLTLAMAAVLGAAGLSGNALAEDTSGVVTWKSEYYTAVGAEANIVDGGYSDQGNTLEIKCRDIRSDLYLTLPEFEEYDAGDKVHLSFRLNPNGMVGSYTSFELCTWGGVRIDYAYEYNVWNWVNYDATILEVEGKNTVLLSFNKALREKVSISEFIVDENLFETEGMFGGVDVYQYEGSPQTQMLGFVFVTKDGKIVVYDGGYIGDGANLIKLIHQHGRVVNGWFISHYHNDHVTGLKEILENSDIVIENLYHDFPDDKAHYDQYGDGDNWLITAIPDLAAQYPGKVQNVVRTKQKDVFQFDELTVKVLNDADNKTTVNYGNNTTVVYKVETPVESILLLGDLGESGDKFIQDPYFLSEMRTCRVVSMAHHGQNGTSRAFYNCIDDIKVALYSAPLWLYDNDQGGGINSGPWKTLQTRGWMRDAGVRISLCTADGRIHFN
ncbi:MAG: MBL fold metallo-hydrolase [Clostridia bacterium]|nr:MBL fold metallo-hydrolase [Clostridia bacterium]